MKCPNGHKNLQKVLFHDVEADYCPECLGIFFNKGELEYAKNDKDNKLNWADFDIWRHKENFKISDIRKKCPVCNVSFVEVAYDDAGPKIDFCKKCEGIWLDRGEFKQIMVYLRKKADYDILNNYTKNLVKELWEVFTGPEKFREEMADFLTLLKLFNYKFMAQHPHITKVISEDMPK